MRRILRNRYALAVDESGSETSVADDVFVLRLETAKTLNYKTLNQGACILKKSDEPEEAVSILKYMPPQAWRSILLHFNGGMCSFDELSLLVDAMQPYPRLETFELHAHELSSLENQVKLPKLGRWLLKTGFFKKLKILHLLYPHWAMSSWRCFCKGIGFSESLTSVDITMCSSLPGSAHYLKEAVIRRKSKLDRLILRVDGVNKNLEQKLKDAYNLAQIIQNRAIMTTFNSMVIRDNLGMRLLLTAAFKAPKLRNQWGLEIRLAIGVERRVFIINTMAWKHRLEHMIPDCFIEGAEFPFKREIKNALYF